MTMSKVAFLGLGAMGSPVARHLIEFGHSVAVWNRSPAAVKAAMARGAKVAPTPRAAAEGPEFVFTKSLKAAIEARGAPLCSALRSSEGPRLQ
jgi:3-hydroxyisobutyrate dehydrogenase-like beta-hydroxyacid dehydrogenase